MKFRVVVWSGLLLVSLGTAGCTRADASGQAPPPETAVTVDVVDETRPAILTLSERAEQRLGIRTEPVRALAGGSQATTTVPYAAVVYDADGKSWAFSEVSARTYTRVPLGISAIRGGQVQLQSGPSEGTLVVVVGAPELVGAEAGISGEE